MTHRYPSGAEWRKWDLHVHVPGTKLSDHYEKKDGAPDLERFADALEGSDVAVFGITDYFSANQTLAFIRLFKKKYPKSEKLMLVNVELRLNEIVNKDTQMVDFHVVFRDSVSEEKIKEYLSKLKTQITDANDRYKTCSELSGNDFSTATVTRSDLKHAFEETFGTKAEPSDFLLYLVPANNNGLRATTGQQRQANLADSIDKLVHAIFGKNPSNTEHFLKTDRYHDKTQRSKPKPVFGGCDAHSFIDLEEWLGKAVDNAQTRQVVTWVKADPSFEGLQQTLVEPGERVSLSELKPDNKDQYKVIKRVRFSGSNDFPEVIDFNPNLNAIIGSRSSGKSALLAHIAHAIDPEYTVEQQVSASKASRKEVGPAAGISWESVESTVVEVEWADGTINGGQVIYVPQNWLYQISDSPREVTAKIRPVLEAQYPAYFREQLRILDLIRTANDAIGNATTTWFQQADLDRSLAADIKQSGDKKSITRARNDIKTQIKQLREANSLSEEDLEKYQEVVGDLDVKRSRLEEIEIENEELNAYATKKKSSKNYVIVDGSVSVDIQVSPDPDDISEALAEKIRALVNVVAQQLEAEVASAVTSHRSSLDDEAKTLKKEIASLESDNKVLLDKHKANATLDELVMRQQAQEKVLDKLARLEEQRKSGATAMAKSVGLIEKHVKSRAEALVSLERAFSKEPRELDQLSFGVAIDFDQASIRDLSEPFNKSENATFLTKLGANDRFVDVAAAQGAPSDFLSELFSGKQRLNRNTSASDVARKVLTATPEVRFTATLDEDRIGGFERSTMTPGKQALFALTLILGEAQERWALLIDQPEDDLDSRSIYGEIVRYLVDQKKQRQIILVTHNANLVVGADAEEVLVANRHGDDRKNRDGRMFDYLTGSLEHSQSRRNATHDLERMGIREHAVEILDGGEEAFQKRRDKYKI